MERELTIVRPDTDPGDENDAHKHEDQTMITTGELIRKLQERAHHVNTNKDNRLLFMNAAYALHQMSEHLHRANLEIAELRGIRKVE